MSAIAEIAQGAVQGLGSVGLGIWNSLNAKQESDRNFAYQKEFNQRIFDREDNAVQRRMADLSSAGLSKTLAAGQSAGTGGTAAVAQENYSEKMSNAINSAVTNALQSFQESINAKKVEAEILNQSSQTDLNWQEFYERQRQNAIRNSLESSIFSHDVLRDTLRHELDLSKYEDTKKKLPLELDILKSQASAGELSNAKAAHDFSFAVESGLPSAYIDRGGIKSDLAVTKVQLERQQRAEQVKKAAAKSHKGKGKKF